MRHCIGPSFYLHRHLGQASITFRRQETVTYLFPCQVIDDLDLLTDFKEQPEKRPRNGSLRQSLKFLFPVWAKFSRERGSRTPHLHISEFFCHEGQKSFNRRKEVRGDFWTGRCFLNTLSTDIKKLRIDLEGFSAHICDFLVQLTLAGLLNSDVSVGSTLRRNITSL